MTKTTANFCLSSVAALAIATALPGMQSFSAAGFSSAAAFARGGSDNSGSGSSGHGGHDDNSGSGHGGHDDSSGSSNSNSGGSDDSSSHAADDNGGHGADDAAGDDHGGRRSHDDTASTDMGTRTRGENGVRRHGRDQAKDRPETTLTVSGAQLQGLLDGSLVAVDQLGRHLEVEVELEHGVRTVKAQVHRSDARSNPGKIITVSINPASAP